MPRWIVFVIGVYLGAALVTFGFQSYVRLHQCAGIGVCTVSLVKGTAWSAAWPLSCCKLLFRRCLNRTLRVLGSMIITVIVRWVTEKGRGVPLSIVDLGSAISIAV